MEVVIVRIGIVIVDIGRDVLQMEWVFEGFERGSGGKGMEIGVI
jgi:hypothetical protein